MPTLRHRKLTETAWIASHVLDAIIDATETAMPLETGGMLLGYEPPEAAGVVITDLIGPGPAAIHGSESFVPDGPWQRRQLKSLYVDSGRITTFLGDWHSHPIRSPLPSRRDRKTARTVAREKEARMPRPITLIVGRHNERWTTAAYRYHGWRFHQMTIEIVADTARTTSEAEGASDA